MVLNACGRLWALAEAVATMLVLQLSPGPDIAQTAGPVPIHSCLALLHVGPNQARSHQGGTMPSTTTALCDQRWPLFKDFSGTWDKLV